MDIIIEHTVFLFIVAVLVALIARKFHLPYTVGLVIAGTGVALVPIKMGIPLTHAFIFDVILPPLLFEAALNIHWKELKRDMLPIMVLAIFGVIISALFISWGTLQFLGWPLSTALIFGVLIAATDPVAVIAMFKDNNITGRLRLLVESESLFNDGVAAVMFAIILAWTQADTLEPASVAGTLTVISGGGILIGAACGFAAIYITGHTTEHLIETALTAIAAYGSFLLAEHLHVSGVLATVTAGLLMGNLGVLKEDAASSLSERGREFILDFWEFVAFLANSLIFLLIGLRTASIPFATLGTVSFIALIGIVLISRALAVYPLCLSFMRSRWAITIPHQHILWWGGLRGALGLALALSLPDTFPMHDEIVIATFGVVAFSVVVQGLTMPLLLRLLKCSN